MLAGGNVCAAALFSSIGAFTARQTLQFNFTVGGCFLSLLT
jgi:hypothetical protein